MKYGFWPLPEIWILHWMSVELHIKNVCRLACCELRRISSIRHLLSVDSTKTLDLFFSSLCNPLLSGCFQHLLEKLQKVQNSGERLVLKARKWDHFSSLLRTPLWLPLQGRHWVQVINVLSRIEYKLSTLCLALSTSYQHFVSHWVQVIDTLSVLFVWYLVNRTWLSR